MSRRVLTLTERRTRVVRLPRDEAHFLLAHARPLLDVVPATERGWYHLTARGWVGFFDGPSIRYVLQPKLPWPSFARLLGLRPRAAPNAEPEGQLLPLLAEMLASRWAEVQRRGLVAGYRDVDTQSPFLRGKLRIAEQLRETASRGFPDSFHVSESIFDHDTPWHRILKAAAMQLLRSGALPAATAQRLNAITQVLATVADDAPSAEAFTTAWMDPRLKDYHEVLAVGRIVLEGFRGASVLYSDPTAAFLIDLGRVFEHYLIRGLQQELAQHPDWDVGSHRAFALGPTVLRPDIVIRRAGSPWAVLDAKWKTVAAKASDLHQILAYRTLTGASRVGLVYPGRSDASVHYFSPDGRIRVSLYRLRIVGSDDQLERSIRRLARRVRND